MEKWSIPASSISSTGLMKSRPDWSWNPEITEEVIIVSEDEPRPSITIEFGHEREHAGRQLITEVDLAATSSMPSQSIPINGGRRSNVN